MACTRSNLGFASSGSLSVTLGSQGDLVVATVDWTAAPSGISNTGSALSWTLVCSGSYSGYGSYTYTALVTAAAAGQTCTVSATGGTVDFLLVDDISSGLGTTTVWTLSNQNPTNPSASTTVTFSSVETGSTGTLCYYGTAWTNETISGGTSPISSAAFTYNFYGASSYVGVAFSGAVAASTSYQPTATAASSASNAANGITLSASVSSSLAPGLLVFC